MQAPDPLGEVLSTAPQHNNDHDSPKLWDLCSEPLKFVKGTARGESLWS